MYTKRKEQIEARAIPPTLPTHELPVSKYWIIFHEKLD